MAEQRTKGFVIGKVLGAPVIVQPSTLVTVAVVAFLFAQAVGEATTRTITIGVVLALALIASVFLHELAHALAARSFGRSVTEIVLTVWGGHTSFDARQLTPVVSAVTAAAGPAMNLALWGVFTASAQFTDGLLAAILASVAASNLLLGLFNLLPGIPMDGGKLVEAVAWRITRSRDKGTLVGGYAGRIVAVAVVVGAIAVPLLRGQQIDSVSAIAFLFVASMVWASASAAIKVAKLMLRRDAMSVSSVMHVAVGVPYGFTVAQARALAGDTHAEYLVVIGADASPAGFFPAERLDEVPQEMQDSTSLAAVTSPLPRGAVIDAQAGSDVVIPELRHWWGRTEAWVVMSGESVVGIVRLVDVVAALK